MSCIFMYIIYKQKQVQLTLESSQYRCSVDCLNRKLPQEQLTPL